MKCIASNHTKRNFLEWFLLGLTMVISGCTEQAPTLPPIEVNPTATEQPIMADCFAYFYLSAWEDSDEDGVWDEGENPLEGVEFFVSGRFAYSNNRGRGISDEQGEAVIDTWTPERCPETFSLRAVPPEGYQLTTDSPLDLEGSGNLGGKYQFGFRLLSE